MWINEMIECLDIHQAGQHPESQEQQPQASAVRTLLRRFSMKYVHY